LAEGFVLHDRADFAVLAFKLNGVVANLRDVIVAQASDEARPRAMVSCVSFMVVLLVFFVCA
jgi:hypothetical protein